MTKIIKVDRVKSVNEAQTLENLGANLISVSLNRDPRFSDDRTVTIDTAVAIEKTLQSCKYVGEFIFNGEYSFNEFSKIVERVEFDFVQLVGAETLPIDLYKDLETKGIGVIYCVEASHDDDPAWILSHFTDKEFNVSYFQVDLLPEYLNSWNFLKNESPKYPEELQIEDINQIGEEHPLLISLDYSASNALEILNSMSTIRGISIVLGESALREDVHYFQYSKALEVLDRLRRSKSIFEI